MFLPGDVNPSYPVDCIYTAAAELFLDIKTVSVHTVIRLKHGTFSRRELLFLYDMLHEDTGMHNVRPEGVKEYVVSYLRAVCTQLNLEEDGELLGLVVNNTNEYFVCINSSRVYYSVARNNRPEEDHIEHMAHGIALDEVGLT